MVERVFEDYLLRRTFGIRHSGRDFYKHLKGTHDLLRDWGNPEYICLGGLFHSVYGTNSFRHQSVDFKERPTVRALIGPEAEYLAYLFCVIDRPRIFFDAGNSDIFTCDVYDNHCHTMIRLRHTVRDALLEIEAANLIEQGALNQRIINRLLLTAISPSARWAIEAYK